MRIKKNRLTDYITYMVKYYWIKLIKVLEKIFVPILLSAISSGLSFLVLYFFPQINRMAMLIALILFSYSLFEYTFRYSFSKKHIYPYWMDVILPCGMFSLLVCVGYFFIPPKIFNYIFLPVRVFEVFYLKSWISILIVLVFMFLLMTITRLLGRHIKLKKRKERH